MRCAYCIHILFYNVVRNTINYSIYPHNDCALYALRCFVQAIMGGHAWVSFRAENHVWGPCFWFW